MLFYEEEETKLQAGDIISISEEGFITISRFSTVTSGGEIRFGSCYDDSKSDYYVGNMLRNTKMRVDLVLFIAMISGLSVRFRKDLNHENNKRFQFFELF